MRQIQWQVSLLLLVVLSVAHAQEVGRFVAGVGLSIEGGFHLDQPASSIEAVPITTRIIFPTFAFSTNGPIPQDSNTSFEWFSRDLSVEPFVLDPQNPPCKWGACPAPEDQGFITVFNREIGTMIRERAIFKVHTVDEINLLFDSERQAREAAIGEVKDFITESVASLNVVLLEDDAREQLVNQLTVIMINEIESRTATIKAELTTELLQDEAFLTQLREQLLVDETQE